ncbi:MAG: WD domain, G-beta repeat [Candidatus Dependentiae bacterium ADurb.Bin331]|nr:MAG: WD domain, G-beta repeat [Candidatus Dependentiae bacterium ADurb.Bin331]
MKKLLLCLLIVSNGALQAMEAERSAVSGEQSVIKDNITILCADNKKLLRPATSENIKKLELIKQHSIMYKSMLEDLGATEEQGNLTLLVPSLSRKEARLLWDIALFLDKPIEYNELFGSLSELPIKKISRLLNAADYLDIPVLREPIIAFLLKKITNNDWIKSWVEQQVGNSALNEINVPMQLLLARIIAQNEPTVINSTIAIQNEVPIISLALSSDQKHIATCNENIIFLWDANSGEFVESIKAPSNLTSIVFDSNNQIVGGCDNDNAYVWNGLTRNLIKTFTGHTDTVKAVACSPDGLLVATGSFDGTVRLWDLKNDSSKIIFSDNTKLIQAVVFSHDGTLIAFGGSDKKVSVLSVATNNLIANFVGHTDVIKCVAFSPNGKLIASGGVDKSICIWDIEQQKLARKLTGHEEQINALVFTHDNNKIISASSDATARIWHAVTGQLLNVLKEHTASITSLALAHNDSFLLTGSRDTTAIKWILNLNKNLNLQQQLLMVYLINNAPVALENKKMIALFTEFEPEIKEILFKKYGVVLKHNTD